MITVESLCSGASLSSFVDWLMNSCQNGDLSEALSSLLNLCFHVAGATIDAEKAAFTVAADIQAVLEEVVARVDDTKCMSLLFSKDSALKRLRKNFSLLFQSVAVASETLKIPGFVDSLITWLSHMNESKVRSFRHVALVAACGVADGLHATLSSLQETRSKTNETRIEGQLTSIFQHTVHNRIKDVSPEIRVQAMQILRSWIVGFPSRYCANSYLIYLRFGLYDKKSEMRLETLEAFGAILCEVPSGLEKISALLSKCTERLVEMCKDTETRCAHAAIKLCTVLIKSDFQFENSLVDFVFEGLLDDRSIIRNAVGTFLKHFITITVKKSGASPFAFVVALLHTLRYQCPMLVEEYLVDAMWSPEDPPLVEFVEDFSKLINCGDEEECLKGLRCVASLMRHASGADSLLGPSPKDDLYLVTKKRGATDARDKLLTVFSKMSCDAMESALRSKGSVPILLSISQVIDVMRFEACSQQSLKRFFKAFRNSCLVTNYSVCEIPLLSSAWRKIAFTQYVECSLGEMELKEFSRDVGKHLDIQKSCLQSWVKMALVTSVTHVASWDSFLSALLSSVSQANANHIQTLATVCFQSVMWYVAADTRDNTNQSKERAEMLIEVLLKYSSSSLEGNSADEHVVTVGNVLTMVCDLLSLPFVCVSVKVVELVVLNVVKVSSKISTKHKNSFLCMREIGRRIQQGGNELTSLWERYVPVRAECMGFEKDCAKVIGSLCRVFLLNKFTASSSTALFCVWPSLPKSSSDLLKMLFHALRERQGGNGFLLEKEILNQAITSASIRELLSVSIVGLVGAKLASIHFAPTDKFSSCCSEMVEFAITNCGSEPLWLHATVAYCAKLKQSDAFVAYTHIKQAQHTLGDNPFYGTFLYNIARAAKVTEAKSSKTKRQRDDCESQTVVEDQDLSAAMSGIGEGDTSRLVTKSGWRVNARGQIDDSTLVATQEWD